MELTQAIITGVERTIAERLSIYRGGPYTVRCDLDSRGLQIGVEGLVDYHRVGYAWTIDHHEIEACNEATFARLVQVYAERHFERPLVEYLRNHPAPVPAPRTLPSYGTFNVDVGAINLRGVDWSAVFSRAGLSDFIPVDRDVKPGDVVTLPTPDPERLSRYQLIGAEWLS